MKNIIFLSLIFLSIFSCAPKNYDKPKDLINQSEMIDILTDLYISQQGLQMFPTQNQDQSIDLAKDAVDIMKSYDITFHQFSESYKYYMMQPEKFKDMLNDVKKNLEDKLSDEEKERREGQECSFQKTLEE